MTRISLTTVIWNELLLYPEPSPKIIEVFQHGSKRHPFSPPVGPLGSYTSYVDEYKYAQSEHRRNTLTNTGDYNLFDLIESRKWTHDLLYKKEKVSERLRGKTLTIYPSSIKEDVSTERNRGQLSTVPGIGHSSGEKETTDESNELVVNSGSNSSVDLRRNVATHPFEEWRIFLGYPERVSFCRAGCLSPPQVLNYERARQRTMPKSVRDALKPVVRREFLDQLEFFGMLYYRYRNAGI